MNKLFKCSNYRHKLIDYLTLDEYFDKTLDSNFKGAVFAYSSTVLYRNFIRPKNLTCNILNEALITNQIVFYLTKNFYLVDEINEKISQFKANGMINFWMSKYTHADQTKSGDGLTALSFWHLSASFQLLAYCLAGASIVFIVELFTQLKRCRESSTDEI